MLESLHQDISVQTAEKKRKRGFHERIQRKLEEHLI